MTQNGGGKRFWKRQLQVDVERRMVWATHPVVKRHSSKHFKRRLLTFFLVFYICWHSVRHCIRLISFNVMYVYYPCCKDSKLKTQWVMVTQDYMVNKCKNGDRNPYLSSKPLCIPTDYLHYIQ